MVWCFPKAWAPLCLPIVAFRYSYMYNKKTLRATMITSIMSKRHIPNSTETNTSVLSLSIQSVWSRTAHAIFNKRITCFQQPCPIGKIEQTSIIIGFIMWLPISAISYSYRYINSRHLVGHECKNLHVRIKSSTWMKFKGYHTRIINTRIITELPVKRSWLAWRIISETDNWRRKSKIICNVTCS